MQLQQKLRGAGLRSTALRVAVLRRLERATTPLSHADLVDALADQGLDRVTLYRNLNDLAEAGLVARTDLGDHTWRFELRREGLSHTLRHTSPAPTAAPWPASPSRRCAWAQGAACPGARPSRSGGHPARPLRPL